MGHVVLLGDSIFDNARYVPSRTGHDFVAGRCGVYAGRATEGAP